MRAKTLAMAVAAMLALAPLPAEAQEFDQGELLRLIEERDVLIAAQESLLNVYRCRFGLDAHVVEGGCSDDQPAAGPTTPGAFIGTPTGWEVGWRDRLIANQEALLNAYRCQKGIDTHVVPGGCDPDDRSQRLCSWHGLGILPCRGEGHTRYSNDAILDTWPVKFYFCKWSVIRPGPDAVVYFMDFLWTLTNTSLELWDRFDIYYRVYIGGELVGEDAPRSGGYSETYYEPPKPGETAEYYVRDSFLVFTHNPSDSIVDAWEAHQNGTEIPWCWYDADGNRIDKPDFDADIQCEVEYNNLRNDQI